jgi:hypothetical protein
MIIIQLNQINKCELYNIMLYLFLNFLLSNQKKCYIWLDKDIELIEIQKYLCNSLNKCFIYDFSSYDNNYIVYQIYNNTIYSIIKQNKQTFYIWKINQ